MSDSVYFASQRTDAARHSEKPFPSAVSKTMLVVGIGVIAFGILGLFHSASRTHPGQWIRWFFGALLVHDLILAPVVFAIAALVVSRIPARWRGPVQGGLVASGIVLLFSFPFVLGFGRTPENPSILPNNYAAGLAITLALVWTAAAVALIRRH